MVPGRHKGVVHVRGSIAVVPLGWYGREAGWSRAGQDGAECCWPDSGR